MAEVAVQIRGTLYDLAKKTSQQVVLQGDASLLGLGVGGGPIYPPEGGGSPPGIWGPTDPFPGYGLPGGPGKPPGQPPGIWGGSDPFPGYGLPGGPGKPPGIWPGGKPTHPIELPPTVNPPDPPDFPPTTPEDPNWQWVFNPQTNWIPAYVPEGGKPHPVPPPPGQPK